MAYISGNKRYAVIDNDTMEFDFLYFGFAHDSSDLEPAPDSTANVTFQEVPDTDMGGLSDRDFINQKKPVMVGNPPTFDSWADRDAAPSVTISANPKADGSNTPTVSVSGGTPSSNFMITSSRPIDWNLTNGKGTLDINGDASFMIRVHGLGDFDLCVKPDGHSNFQPATLTVTVDSGF